jgi:tetratricopeptide (TPR) repeat protein
VVSETPKKGRVLSRILVVGGIIFAGLILIAAIIVLFASAKLQQNLLKKQPEYTSQQLYDRAVAQVDTGQYQTAETYLEQALLKQDDATYRNQLAVVKYRLKKYQEAIDQYQKLITDGKDASFAWNGIGNAYRDWADAETRRQVEFRGDAEDSYKKAIVLNSGYVAAYSNLALLYDEEGKKSDAISVLNQGIAATASKDLEQVKTTISTP